MMVRLVVRWLLLISMLLGLGILLVREPLVVLQCPLLSVDETGCIVDQQGLVPMSTFRHDLTPGVQGRGSIHVSNGGSLCGAQLI